VVASSTDSQYRGLYLRMALPLVNRRTSTRSSLGRDVPTSSKARFPCRTTVGTIHRLYSSTSLFAKSVRSSWVRPYFIMVPPLCSLSALNVAATSPVITDAFQVTSLSVVEATSFFRPLIRSKYLSPLICGQRAGKGG